MSRISLRLIASSLTLMVTIGSAAAKPPDTPEPAAGPPPLQPRLHRPAPQLPCPPRGHHRGPAFLEQSPAPLQPDQIRTVMSFCRQHFGGLHRRLEELKQSNPPDYKRLLRRLAPRLLWMQAIYRRRPDLGKLLI
ncbi:MAG: hypothetical protein ACE5K7_01425, partial [Phycisphaerae bacterium]